jgi:hypothetical protein
MMKRSYVKPTVTDHGTLRAITAGTKNGNFLDKSFPTNTPKDQLTFS